MIARYLRRIPTYIPRATPYHFGYTKGSPYHNPIELSTIDLMRQITQRNPSAICINSYSQNTSLSYQQLIQQAEQLATGLVNKFNLKPKDRVGIYAYNKYEWVVVQMAAAVADLILVNINPAYQSDQLAYTIDKVGLSLLFLNDTFKHLNYLKIVEEILPELQTNSPFDLQSNKFPSLKGVIRMNTANDTLKGFVNYTDIPQPANRYLFPSRIHRNDPANIQFTSGTTGRPKAATLSHYNILNNGFAIGQKCRYSQVDNIALSVPFYHCFGNILGTLGAFTRGGGISIITEGFDPKKTLEAVTKYKCTSLYGVPTMFIQYLRQLEENPSRYSLDSLRTGIVAGSLCSQLLMNKILKDLKLRDITNCYGMTETSPVSFQTCPTDPLHLKTTTVGQILPGLQAKIVDSEGNQCKAGETGQFWVKGWAVMLNYWDDEQANRRSLQDGWMKSGDLGVMDAKGYLSIVGRIKDMIIRGGENIYPKEIQQFLVKMPGVLDAQVVSVSDQKYGEQVAAVVKVKDPNDPQLTKESIFAYCKDKIAFYKIPKFIKLVTEYPLTVSGKVQKYILRNDLEQLKKKGALDQYKTK